MATVNIILPDGNTFVTATATATAAVAGDHVHDATDQHEAIHVDNNQVVIDGHEDHVIAITKTLQNDQNYIQCKDEAGDLKFKVTDGGAAEAKVMLATDIFATQFVVAPSFRSVKTLPFGEKYIDCQLDTGVSKFSVDDDGIIRCKSVETTFEVSAQTMNTVNLNVQLDCDIIGELQTLAKPNFQTGFDVPETLNVLYDSVGEALFQQSGDPDDDHSAVVITKKISIEPQQNSDFTPTLHTSGSIALQGAGKLGFKPLHPNGDEFPGTEYDIGRSVYIGDTSHDNDGILLRKRMVSEDSVERNHKVLICPDSTDPNIVVYSRKNAGVDYLHFCNVGPDTDPLLNEYVVFRVKHNGYIESQQINELDSLVLQHQQKIASLEQQLEELLEMME